MTDDNKQPQMYGFTVQLVMRDRWGSPQQVSLETLLHWSAWLSPDIGLKLFRTLKAECEAVACGDVAPISQSGAAALERLGNEQQLALPLPECPLPEPPAAPKEVLP